MNFFRNLFLLFFLFTISFQFNLFATNGEEEMEVVVEVEQDADTILARLKENSLGQKLKDALSQLEQNNEDSFRDLKTVLRAFFSSISYYSQIKIDNDETLQLVLYSIFKASGICVSLGKSGDEPILIAQYNGKNYFISCSFYEIRPLSYLTRSQTKKTRKKISPVKINRKKNIEYAQFDKNGIGFDVTLFGDDTRYQEDQLKINPRPRQIDSKLKIYIGNVFSDVSIMEDQSFSCDITDINDLLSILIYGEEFRENINGKKNLLKNICHNFFKKLPYEISNEKGYDLVLFSIFKMNGLNTDIEQASSAGRSDLVVDASGNIYIFELKYSSDEYDIIKGWDQIIIKRYSEKYYFERQGTPIFGIVIAFGPFARVGVDIRRTLPTQTPDEPEKRKIRRLG
ncbi:MAG: PD-(D/E)XK nuclease domain-containing protein [bacterium]